MEASLALDRETLLRRGRRLEYATISYNLLEAVVSLASGTVSGSIALIGFGLDSLIEVTSAAALLWRFGRDQEHERAEAERKSLRIVGACFFSVGAWVAFDAAKALWLREAPNESWTGIALASASLIVMPLLARAKRRTANDLGSGALEADARQTDLCFYLSGILLGGLTLNAMLGWWWADPLAGLAMLPIILREGSLAWRGETCCACDGACG